MIYKFLTKGLPWPSQVNTLVILFMEMEAISYSSVQNAAARETDTQTVQVSRLHYANKPGQTTSGANVTVKMANWRLL